MALKEVIAFVLVVGSFLISFDAQADVTGSFDLNIIMLPEGRQTEAVKFDFDIRSNLQINATISGVTFGMDAGFGTTGIEFSILSLFTSIGAFQLSDQFVFATPFYTTGAALQGKGLHPTLNSLGQPNGPVFVKKRITVSTNVAGITMTNLAVFEDVDFPNPVTTTNPVYNVDQFDNIIDNQTPTYGFGNMITLSGQTVSGIRISSVTGLCLGRRINLIKGRAWVESVSKACTASLGNNLVDPLANNATPILFDFQSLSIRDVSIGGLDLDTDILIAPFEGKIALESVSLSTALRIFDIADLRVRYRLLRLDDAGIDLQGDVNGDGCPGVCGIDDDGDGMTDEGDPADDDEDGQIDEDIGEEIDGFGIASSGIQIRVVSENFTIIAVDQDSNLEIDSLVFSANIALNPNQNPAALRSTTVLNRLQGLAGQSLTLTVRRGMMTWFASTSFGRDSTTGSDLDWVGSSMGMFFQTDSLGSLAISTVMDFAPTGMSGFEISLDFAF